MFVRSTTLKALLVACSLLISTIVSAKIVRFQQVDQQIYRGSQPTTQKDYNKLEKLGIRYVFNFRDDQNEILWEKAELEKRGIVLLSYPMSPWDTPNASTVKQILNQIATANQTTGVFVHCHHGKDRTGVIMALYRIHYQGWDRMQAYAEMAKFGFNHIFWDMLDFFWKHSKPGAFNSVK